MEEVKTPEQMAKEYAEDWHQDCDYPEEILRHTKKATASVFLAGYKAAKDQLADAGKVMPEWIRVKDRLPEHGVPVLVFDTLANTIELMSWDKIMEVFETDDAYFVQLNDASHWMPLPKPPEE